MITFVFLIFGVGLLFLFFSIAGYIALSYFAAAGVAKKFGRRYLFVAFVALCLLPFAYSWLAQVMLVSKCNEAQSPQILEIRRDVDGFFYNGDSTYDLVANEIFEAGFKFVETLGGGQHYKYVTYTVKDGELSGETYSNELHSRYEVAVSEPQMTSLFWSLYSTNLTVTERASGKVLGKLTDYLWGAPSGIWGWYMNQFFGRPFLSCGPGLSKGWINWGIVGQRRLDDYNRRDAQFIQSVLRVPQ